MSLDLAATYAKHRSRGSGQRTDILKEERRIALQKNKSFDRCSSCLRLRCRLLAHVIAGVKEGLPLEEPHSGKAVGWFARNMSASETHMKHIESKILERT